MISAVGAAAIAIAVASVLAECDAGPEFAPPLFLLRSDFPCVIDADGSVDAREAGAIGVCGDHQRAFVLERGESLRLELPALPVAAWIDLAVACLPSSPDPPWPTRPLPPARLIVTREVRGAETLLYDGFPSAGLPPAFGYGETRIELKADLGEESFLHLRAEADATIERFAVAVQRIAPRATAADRAWALLYLCIEVGDAPPGDAEVEALLAAPGVAVQRIRSGEPLPFVSGSSAAADSATWPDADAAAFDATELIVFGRTADLDPIGPNFDRLIMFDPLPSAVCETSASFCREGWDPAVLDERRRSLGEHLLFEQIARPRHAPSFISVGTRLPAAAALAALRRLAAHIAANDLADRCLLRVAFDAPSGAALGGWWRWPTDVARRAPAVLLERALAVAIRGS